MEPTQDSVPDDGAVANAAGSPSAMGVGLESASTLVSGSAPALAPRTRQSLPSKGSCWYCEGPLDNVRRFCDKECADAFDEEKQFTR